MAANISLGIRTEEAKAGAKQFLSVTDKIIKSTLEIQRAFQRTGQLDVSRASKSLQQVREQIVAQKQALFDLERAQRDVEQRMSRATRAETQKRLRAEQKFIQRRIRAVRAAGKTLQAEERALTRVVAQESKKQIQAAQSVARAFANVGRGIRGRAAQGVAGGLANIGRSEAIRDLALSLGLLVPAAGQATTAFIALDTAVDALTSAAILTQGPLSGVGARVQNIGRLLKQNKLFLVGSVAGFAALSLAITKAIKIAADFELGLVKVAKVMNLSAEATADLGDRLNALSARIGVSSDEILKIAESAGRLGIRGTENIEVFTETIAMLTRTTDLGAEEAATSIARLLNVTNESTSTVSQLADVLVALGNNFAATEAEILEQATALGQAGAAFGLTSTQALKLGAVIKALGQQTRGAATAVTRVFTRMTQAVSENTAEARNQLSIFARVANVSLSEFTKIVREDSFEAFQKFTEGLSELKGGAEAILPILDDLNIAQERQLPIALALVTASQELGRAQRVAAAAAGANKEEFDRLNDSVNRQAEILKVRLVATLRELGKGALPAVKTALKGVNSVLLDFFDAIRGASNLEGFALQLASAFFAIGTAVETASLGVVTFFNFMQIGFESTEILVRTFAKALLQLMVGNFTGALETLRDGFEEIKVHAKKNLNDIENAAGSFVSSTIAEFNRLVAGAEQSGEGVRDALKRAVSIQDLAQELGVEAQFRGQIDALRDLALQTGNSAEAQFKFDQIANQLVATLKEMAKRTFEAGGGVDELSSKFTSARDTVQGLINDLRMEQEVTKLLAQGNREGAAALREQNAAREEAASILGKLSAAEQAQIQDMLKEGQTLADLIVLIKQRKEANEESAEAIEKQQKAAQKANDARVETLDGLREENELLRIKATQGEEAARVQEILNRLEKEGVEITADLRKEVTILVQENGRLSEATREAGKAAGEAGKEFLKLGDMVQDSLKKIFEGILLGTRDFDIGEIFKDLGTSILGGIIDGVVEEKLNFDNILNNILPKNIFDIGAGLPGAFLDGVLSEGGILDKLGGAILGEKAGFDSLIESVLPSGLLAAGESFLNPLFGGFSTATPGFTPQLSQAGLPFQTGLFGGTAVSSGLFSGGGSAAGVDFVPLDQAGLPFQTTASGQSVSNISTEALRNIRIQSFLTAGGGLAGGLGGGILGQLLAKELGLGRTGQTVFGAGGSLAGAKIGELIATELATSLASSGGAAAGSAAAGLSGGVVGNIGAVAGILVNELGKAIQKQSGSPQVRGLGRALEQLALVPFEHGFSKEGLKRQFTDVFLGPIGPILAGLGRNLDPFSGDFLRKPQTRGRRFRGALEGPLGESIFGLPIETEKLRVPGRPRAFEGAAERAPEFLFDEQLGPQLKIFAENLLGADAPMKDLHQTVQILANNFKTLGVTVEEAQSLMTVRLAGTEEQLQANIDALRQQFAEGEITFTEFQERLQQMTDMGVATFEDFQQAANVALKRIAAEAGQGLVEPIRQTLQIIRDEGINSFGELANASADKIGTIRHQIATQLGPEAVQIFNALTSQGIASFQDLANATGPQIKQLINLLRDLGIDASSTFNNMANDSGVSAGVILSNFAQLPPEVQANFGQMRIAGQLSFNGLSQASGQTTNKIRGDISRMSGDGRRQISSLRSQGSSDFKNFADFSFNQIIRIIQGLESIPTHINTVHTVTTQESGGSGSPNTAGVTTNTNTTAAPPPPPPRSDPTDLTQVRFHGFQHGGAFSVPFAGAGAGGPDSQLVSFRATPGEQIIAGFDLGESLRELSAETARGNQRAVDVLNAIRAEISGLRRRQEETDKEVRRIGLQTAIRNVSKTRQKESER